jgi:hypothetical protein
MGTHKKGILGNFSGKVGTVVGSTWRGIWVMRGLTDAKRKAQSGSATAAGEIYINGEIPATAELFGRTDLRHFSRGNVRL